LETNENSDNNDLKLRNASKTPEMASNADYFNNFTTPTETINIHNVSSHQESINDALISPVYNNGLIDHNIHRNTDNKNHDFQNLTWKQQEHLNADSNMSSNSSGSLQKEHLLQMANAVANVLVDEVNIEDTALANCDLEQKNQFLTCCLEEQKKVVSQLHIQVSQYVSLNLY
jgi:ABC-type antimicrobial peptide transport system ATPase subunit